MLEEWLRAKQKAGSPVRGEGERVDMPKIEKEKLMEGLAFESDEQRQVFESMLSNEKNLETMSDRYMMRSDYSRQSDEAKRAKEEAARKEQEAEGLKVAVLEYEQSVKEDIEAKNAYEAYLKQIGVEPQKARTGLGTEGQPATTQPPQAPAFDPKSLKKDYLGRDEAGQLGNLLVDMQFSLQEIASEHQELFGKAPKDLSNVRAKFLDPQNKRSLREIAAEEFHFAERQKEIADKTLTEEIDRRVEEQLVAERSKQGIRAPVEDIPTSVVFEEKFAEGAKVTDHDKTRQMIDAALLEDAALAQTGVRITQ